MAAVGIEVPLDSRSRPRYNRVYGANMSTDYYMTCDGCKEAIDIASWGISGFSFYHGNREAMKALTQFLERHTLCGSGSLPRLCDEHYVHYAEYKRIEWNANSVVQQKGEYK